MATARTPGGSTTADTNGVKSCVCIDGFKAYKLGNTTFPMVRALLAMYLTQKPNNL